MVRDLELAAAVVLVAAAVTGVTVAASAGAAAQATNESDLEGVLDPGDDLLSLDGLEAAAAGADGLQARFRYWVSRNLPGAVTERVPGLAPPETSAERIAISVTSYYNAHNETLDEYANDRGDFSSDYVVEISIHLDGETATRYLNATDHSGNISTSVESSKPGTVTESVDVCGFAAAHAHDELEVFVEEYAEPNKDVDKRYLGRLRGRYGPFVESSLYPTSGNCPS